MNILKITRPKSKEKYYDEASLKLYVNGVFKEKIGQDETREIQLEEDEIEFRVKSKMQGCLPTRVKLDQNNKLEVIVNPNLRAHPIYALIALSPFSATILISDNNIWLKALTLCVWLMLVCWALVRYVNLRRNGVLIKTVDNTNKCSK